MPTLGEYRVGISFNPSKDPAVDEIKRAAADLIDLIDRIDTIDDDDSEVLHDSEVLRLKALAMTHVEDAAMWAVKACTKPVRK